MAIRRSTASAAGSLSAAVALSLGVTGALVTAAVPGRSAPAAATPMPAGSQVLSGVSCVSNDWCVAVGSDPQGLLAESWNGRTWSVMPVREPAGPPARLDDVSCLSADYCWAVGYDGTSEAVAELWNSWSVSPTPLFDQAAPAVAVAALAGGGGYYVAYANGYVAAHGSARDWGNASSLALHAPIVGMAIDPVTGGHWLLGGDGGIFSFHAPYHGSTGGMHLSKPVVGMAATAAGGYRLVASDGGIFDFGPGAEYYGSMGGHHLNEPVVGMASDEATGGYWLVASDGGIFSFHAPFLGSAGNLHLAAPIVGMEAGQLGNGYRFVGSDGGIFCYGRAKYGGSLGGRPIPFPVVGMAAPASDGGYWLVDQSGAATAYGAT